MDIKEELICRLCFNVITNDSREIEGRTRHLLDIILLQLDLDVSRNPIICQDCVRIAEKCLYFKLIYLNTEKNILLFCVGRKTAEFDIKDVYREMRCAVTVFNEDLNICRFCMIGIKSNKFTSLEILMNNTMFQMSQYIPELDMNIIMNPLICTSCRSNLECYFKFVRKCLGIEENIRAYCQEVGTDRIGQVKLRNVLRFLFKRIQIYPEVHCEMIKLEELDIKEKDINLDEDSCNRSPMMLNKCANIVDSNENDSELKLYKCSLCVYKAKQKGSLKRHMLIHIDTSEIEKHKCSLCGFETIRKQTLSRHMLIHKDISEVNTYKCSSCAYQTKYSMSLKRHMLVHKNISEIETYKCSLCTYRTKRKSYIKTHMLIHKDVSEVVMYKCPSCAFESRHKNVLKSHLIVHKYKSAIHKENNYPSCKSANSNEESLKNDLLVDKDTSDIEKYKCSLCAFETIRKITLARHMLVHKDVTEVKSYECSLCTYKAKQKGSVKRHMLIHKDISEIETYKCLQCAYRTKRKSNLKTHMLVHKDISEIKMFKCSFCPFEVKHKCNLKKHTLIHKTQ